MNQTAASSGPLIRNISDTALWVAVYRARETERPDALFVGPDAFFVSRAVQFATLTAREKIPAAYAVRELVAAGGLMSYGTDLADMSHQVGVYTGNILKGAKPADLPVDAVCLSRQECPLWVMNCPAHNTIAWQLVAVAVPRSSNASAPNLRLVAQNDIQQ